MICPACGRSGIDPRGLPHHLRGKHCVKKHSDDEARRLAASAPRDPRPWDLARRRAEAYAQSLEEQASLVSESVRSGYAQAAQAARLRAQGLEALGPERYDATPEEITEACDERRGLEGA